MTVGTREPQLNPQTQSELEPLPIYSLYVNCLFVCLLSLAPLSVVSLAFDPRQYPGSACEYVSFQIFWKTSQTLSLTAVAVIGVMNRTTHPSLHFKSQPSPFLVNNLLQFRLRNYNTHCLDRHQKGEQRPWTRQQLQYVFPSLISSFSHFFFCILFDCSPLCL